MSSKTLYKTATDKLSDFKRGMGDEIKADRDCAASNCFKLQLAMHSQLPEV